MTGADIGILGGGLAGILLAQAIEARGGSVVLADTPTRNAASPMAPGIINPLAGRKYKVNADYAATHRATLAAFSALEKRLEQQLWHPVKIIRLIEHPEQRAFVESRQTEPDGAAWLGETYPPGAHGSVVHDPHGSFETRQGGWFDVPALVRAARSTGGFQWVQPEDLPEAAPVTVDCRGWRCSEDPLWRALPWKCARGEVMTVELAHALPRHLWNGGGWLQPLPDGRWRAGATYAWSQFEAPPQFTAQVELASKLRRWLRSELHWVAQEVGVRAVVVDYRPVLGALPSAPNRHIFSGLGSHGAIQGPPCATALAEHLLNQAPLPRDVNVARFA